MKRTSLQSKTLPLLPDTADPGVGAALLMPVRATIGIPDGIFLAAGFNIPAAISSFTACIYEDVTGPSYASATTAILVPLGVEGSTESSAVAAEPPVAAEGATAVTAAVSDIGASAVAPEGNRICSRAGGCEGWLPDWLTARLLESDPSAVELLSSPGRFAVLGALLSGTLTFSPLSALGPSMLNPTAAR